MGSEHRRPPFCEQTQVNSILLFSPCSPRLLASRSTIVSFAWLPVAGRVCEAGATRSASERQRRRVCHAVWAASARVIPSNCTVTERCSYRPPLSPPPGPSQAAAFHFPPSHQPTPSQPCLSPRSPMPPRVSHSSMPRTRPSHAMLPRARPRRVSVHILPFGIACGLVHAHAVAYVPATRCLPPSRSPTP